ncbi:MAG: protein kinase [Desulfobacterales bacterium]|nr:protein kinase [Desulfobacterales bacterium]
MWDANQSEIIKVIKEIEEFKSLTNNELVHLLDKLDVIAYEEGDLIIEQGKPGYTMHIILRGKVKVTFIDDKGKHYILERLSKGAIFGEMALLTDKPRSANVVAESSVLTCVMEKQTLKDLLGFHPNIARFFTRILRERFDKDHAMAVGTYVLQKEIGQGSIGIVYKGRCNLDRNIAAKMLRHDRATEKKFRQVFFEEAKIMAQLRHPNIVRLYAIEEAYGTYFIIMEYLEGFDLKTYLRIRNKMNPYEIMNILNQIGEALKYAHLNGVVHRDVKPNNCIVTQELGDIKITLTDFGLAFDMAIGLKENTKIAGTPLYISPEAIQSDSIDYRADIYALGIIAYQLVTGTVPFCANSVSDLLWKHINEPPPPIRKDIPVGLAIFIEKALVKDPKQRISDWDEILNLLSIDYNIRISEINSFRNINFFIKSNSSAFRIMQQAFEEGSKLLNADIICYLLVPAWQGGMLKDRIEKILRDLMEFNNLPLNDVNNTIKDIKAIIENGNSRKELIKIALAGEYTFISNDNNFNQANFYRLEIHPNSGIEMVLHSGIGHCVINCRHSSFPSIYGQNNACDIAIPGSYAILPLTQHDYPILIEKNSFSHVQAYLKDFSTNNTFPKQDVLGVIQVFLPEEEFDEKIFMLKLKSFQFFVSHALTFI